MPSACKGNSPSFNAAGFHLPVILDLVRANLEKGRPPISILTGKVIIRAYTGSVKR